MFHGDRTGSLMTYVSSLAVLLCLFLTMSKLPAVYAGSKSDGVPVTLLHACNQTPSLAEVEVAQNDVITLRADGSTQHNEDVVSSERLVVLLQARMRNRQDRLVLLTADPDVEYGRFARFAQDLSGHVDGLNIFLLPRRNGDGRIGFCFPRTDLTSLR